MQDTIAALATPPARSAVGMLRISGPGAQAVLARVFRARSRQGTLRARRMTLGVMHGADGTPLDEGLAVWMPAPGSYTGEDSAELYCHGSPGVLEGMLRAVYAAGARPALPGEFTKRAFLNGRLDLTQAEAVMDIIDSESEQAAKNALAQLGGALGKRVAAVRGRLVALGAHFYGALDFPEDDIPPLVLAESEETLRALADELGALRDSHVQGSILQGGVPCVLAGRPNSGKSSLLNALAGEERSIVTDIPGTTRDVVDHGVRIGNVRLRMRDTAGLRDTEDAVERIGVARALGALETAGLVIAVFDGARPFSQEDARLLSALDGAIPALAVVNKCDLPSRLDTALLNGYFERVVHVSAVTGEGMDTLREEIAAHVPKLEAAFDGGIVTNPRQADALSRAAAHIENGAAALRAGMTADAVLTDIEAGIEALGELTGETVSEELLHAVFSRFCIGK